SRPAFDFVLQAATGMEMTQGAGTPQPVNFTTLDYGTGLHLAVGAVLALLARARGQRIGAVDASLMMTATVFQAEHIAQIALEGRDGADVSRDLQGPTPWSHLYAAEDGWLAVCAVTAEQQAGLRRAFALDELSVRALAGAIGGMTLEKVRALLRANDVPSAVSVHPGAVPDDEQVRDRDLLVKVPHPVAGDWVQVGVPLRLSADMPAVKGPAPNPGRARRRTRTER